ncbi:MAG: hypothetical protein ACTSQY_11185, partial [Candidatus Odinarchaeia archaeon]
MRMFDFSDPIKSLNLNDITNILMNEDHKKPTNRLIHHFLSNIGEDDHHPKIHEHHTGDFANYQIINPGAFIQDFLEDSGDPEHPNSQKHYNLNDIPTFNITKDIITNTYLNLNYDNKPINIVSSEPKTTIFSGWIEFEKQNGIFDQEEIKVNEYCGNKDHRNPKMACDEVGNYIIVWQDNRNDNWDIYYQRYTSSGEKIGDNVQVTSATNYQYDPDVSMNKQGEFVISWTSSENGGDIYCQRFDKDGNSLGGYDPGGNWQSGCFQVSNGSAYPQLESSVSLNNNGQFVVIWKDSRNSGGDYWDVWFQRYNNDGSRYG